MKYWVGLHGATNAEEICACADNLMNLATMIAGVRTDGSTSNPPLLMDKIDIGDDGSKSPTDG
jgi:hypothetical protein